MQLSVLSNESDVIRVSCTGDITLTDFRTGNDPFEQMLGAKCFGRKVLLSLENTNYIDSSGVGWLVVHHKHFIQGGGRLIVHSVPPRVDQMFALLQLGRVLAIVSDESAALALAESQKSPTRN